MTLLRFKQFDIQLNEANLSKGDLSKLIGETPRYKILLDIIDDKTEIETKFGKGTITWVDPSNRERLLDGDIDAVDGLAFKLTLDTGEVQTIRLTNIIKTSTFGGAGTKKISENTQELMVAAMLLLNKRFATTVDFTDAKRIIDEAKTKFNMIVGSEGKSALLNQFDGNYSDLATAISTVEGIQSVMKGATVEAVYWTGKYWHKDIKEFNQDIG